MFVYMIVAEEICGEISVRKDKGSDRKSRPPLGEVEEVDSKVGKNWAGQKVARVNLLRARRAP